MADLVKVKGLKGKQNKKKWAKNIDVSALLEAQAKQHDEEYRAKFRQDLVITDDNDLTRPPLDPNRFKQTVTPLPKTVYNNKATRNLGLTQIDDPWSKADEGRHLYRMSEVPSVIAPETGHSYNPREGDIEKLKDRVIDFEASVPIPRKVKAKSELPEIEIRHRNKKKRAAQLATKSREEDREFRQQLHNMKKIRKVIEEKDRESKDRLKTKLIKKEQLHE